MSEGCPERLTWELVRWIWTYPAERRPRILQRLSKLEAGQRVFVLRSSSEVEKFLRELSRQPA
jgi:uncharacterized protein (DUF2249 family)